MLGLLAVLAGGEGFGASGAGVRAVACERAVAGEVVVVQVVGRRLRETVLGAEVVFRDIQALVTGVTRKPDARTAGALGTVLLGVSAEVARQVVVLHLVVGLGAGVVEVVGQTIDHLHVVPPVQAVHPAPTAHVAVVLVGVGAVEDVVVLPLVTIGIPAVGIGVKRGAQGIGGVVATVSAVGVVVAYIAPTGEIGGT